MQQQISNAVRLLIGAPPDLLVLEQSKTALDLWQEVFRQMMLRAGDESLADITHSSPRLSPLPWLILPGGVCVWLCVAPGSPFLQAWRARSDALEAPKACGWNQRSMPCAFGASRVKTSSPLSSELIPGAMLSPLSASVNRFLDGTCYRN